VKILAVSDVELDSIYGPRIVQRFGDVDLVIGCGDLPYYYLEYIISMLNRPLYYVRGNHASGLEEGSGGARHEPWGAINLHKRSLRDESGLLLAGIEGCVRYNYGPHQYSQTEMWSMVFQLAPKLMINKMLYGRYLDIFVSHAPPWKIHDKDDRPHQGVKAFRWLIHVFKPTYHLHGHIHLYRQDEVYRTQVEQTQLINTYGFREITIDVQRPTRFSSLRSTKSGKDSL
jgi:Icc-related predicted phosphoesterase